MQPIESSARPATRGLGSKLTLAVMVVLLLVAIIFAANENDVIGWLVVIIAGGWLILAVATVMMVRRGAKAVKNQTDRFSAAMAGRSSQTVQVVEEAGDPMRDTKLDHSFKIVEVQVRVINKEFEKGAEADQDMIARALDTIEMTASNARDMIDPDRHEKKKKSNSGNEGPITGEVL